MCKRWNLNLQNFSKLCFVWLDTNRYLWPDIWPNTTINQLRKMTIPKKMSTLGNSKLSIWTASHQNVKVSNNNNNTLTFWPRVMCLWHGMTYRLPLFLARMTCLLKHSGSLKIAPSKTQNNQNNKNFYAENHEN
jgi:hypothetical protein